MYKMELTKEQSLKVSQAQLDEVASIYSTTYDAIAKDGSNPVMGGVEFTSKNEYISFAMKRWVKKYLS